MGQITVEQYFARAGSRFTDEDAQIIGPELKRLGPATAKQIVDAARDPNSPLHPYFEWDDHEAAERFREGQARVMAASIMVRVVDRSGKEQTVRAFQAVRLVTAGEERESEEKPAQKVYMDVYQVTKDPNLYQQVIREARSYLETWKQKYAIYRQLSPEFNERFTPVFTAIERASGE